MKTHWNKFRLSTVVSLAAILCLDSAQAAPVQWKVADGGNGHYYEAVLFTSAINWQDARDDAISKGGELASLTSAEENEFVFALVDSAEYWTLAGPHNYGPWNGA